MQHDIERVGAVCCAIVESPFWNAQDNAWFWVNISAARIWRLDAASGALRAWRTPEMVACIAAMAGGGLIAGMETGIFALKLGLGETVTATKLAAPAELGPGMRFNDGRCDRQGRFWSGTMFMGMAAARADGHLYRYDLGGGLSAPVVSGLITQNGLAWSPDGYTMYLSDSHPARQLNWAYDYDPAAGMPHGRRLFVDMNRYPGRPDGVAVDADGCYRTAANDAGLLLRFTPQGELDRQIALPMAKPSMCCFGGPDLDMLLVTSINPGAVAASGEDAGLAGAVLLVRPGVSGLAETAIGA